MNGVEIRLLPAGLLALTLHGAALSWQMATPPATLPTPLPCQRVTVSLGVREVVRERPVEKKVLPPAKPIVRKTVPKKPQAQPKPEEQSIVQTPAPVKERPAENQPPAESAPPSPRADIENESGQATPAAARVIRQATPLYQINPPPQYPRQARRRGLEGVVLLDVLIEISGRVANLRLFSSSGHPLLDRAALKAVRRWRFTPGTIGGREQEMWVTVPIRFQLK